MKSFYHSKRNIFYGNIINWSDALWDVSHMTIYDSSHMEVCKKLESEMDLYVAKQELDMHSGNILCKAQKGRLNVITDQENQLRVMSAIKEKNCRLGKSNYQNQYYMSIIYF